MANQESNQNNEYSRNRIEELELKLRKDDITKWILMVFAANNFSPIKGKIMLTKLVFLFVNEIEPSLAKKFDFFPYQYGPYSTELAKRINRLLDVGWLESNKKGSIWEFSLSNSGKELVDDFKDDLGISEEKIMKLDEMKVEKNKLPLKKLLKLIYTKFPEFGIDSRISG